MSPQSLPRLLCSGTHGRLWRHRERSRQHRPSPSLYPSAIMGHREFGNPNEQAGMLRHRTDPIQAEGSAELGESFSNSHFASGSVWRGRVCCSLVTLCPALGARCAPAPLVQAPGANRMDPHPGTFTGCSPSFWNVKRWEKHGVVCKMRERGSTKPEQAQAFLFKRS